MKSPAAELAPHRLSHLQELLLMAALLPGSEGREAGVKWLHTVNLDGLTRAENRLIPLAYDNLRESGVNHPLMPLLKGVKRHCWCWNQMLFKESAYAIELLQQVGIDVMLIKGAALAHSVYAGDSLRAMYDLDLLVRTQDAHLAVQCLLDNGWKTDSMQAVDLEVQYCHARHFFCDSRHNFDLHWHLLSMCLARHTDDTFWDNSEELDFNGKRLRILNPADQLLHTCVHGAQLSSGLLQWVADAVMIVRKTPDLNWDRLLSQANERELIVVLREALKYVSQTFGAPVPENVLRELNATPVMKRHEREYRSLISPRSGIVKPIEAMLLQYDRVSRMRARSSSKTSFSDFLCVYWGIGDKHEIPMEAFRKLGSRLKVMRTGQQDRAAAREDKEALAIRGVPRGSGQNGQN